MRESKEHKKEILAELTTSVRPSYERINHIVWVSGKHQMHLFYFYKIKTFSYYTPKKDMNTQ